MRISIVWDSGKVIAEVGETPTGRKLFDALPCESTANTWGDEVYFSVPVSAELEEDARQVVDPGTVCCWGEGTSLAIPFGPSPSAKGDECRLVTKVNVVAKIDGDPTLLSSVRDGDRIRVERVAE